VGTGGSTAGRGGSGGTTGSGGTGGSTAGRGGSGGTGGSTAGRGGSSGTTGSGGTTGAGGTTGDNCVETIILMGYASPPAMPCSACLENGMSREMQCKAMIDCLEMNYPCTGNCHTQCRNMAGVSGPTETCVTALVNASCM
jgi:hypothetical protein